MKNRLPRSGMRGGRWLIALAILLLSPHSQAQQKEIDENGQVRLRYALDLPAEIAKARASAQAIPGQEAAFSAYSQKINDLDALVNQLQTLHQSQASAQAIASQKGLISTKVQEILFLIPQVNAPTDSALFQLVHRVQK